MKRRFPALLAAGVLSLSEVEARAGEDWSGYGVIDIHAHMGDFRGFDLSLPTLLANLKGHGVRLALVSNIDGAQLPGTTRNLDETAANQATLAVVKKYPDRLRGLAWTRPNDGDAANIEPFLRGHKLEGDRPAFVGLKFHPEMNQFPADSQRIDPYLDLCGKYRLPAVFHCGSAGSNSDPKRIYAAARRHPKVPVVLYHMGFFGQHKDAIAVVQESIDKGDALLYLETAQADPDAVLRAIRQFGSQRVLFGTDASYYGREHYSRYEALVRRLKARLAADDFANVMHANAERLFPLK